MTTVQREVILDFRNHLASWIYIYDWIYVVLPPSIGYLPLRPISLNNASFYIDKLSLISANPTTQGRAGSIVSLNFENGDKGLEFKLAEAVNDSKGGIVQLEDIIWLHEGMSAPGY